jgi:hypothetical protein
MGYTTHEKLLVCKHAKPGMSVLDFGSQNDYTTGDDFPPFISEWFKKMECPDYTCIDLAGDNGALQIDVSYPVDLGRQFDLVLDIGFGEHVVRADEYYMAAFMGGHINSVYPSNVKSVEEGYYNFWLNKFNLLKDRGIMISVNPKTENWPGHCYTWVNFNTYWQLSRLSGLAIIEIGEHPASGNSVDGWEIFCVMKKLHNHFPTFEDFKSKVQVYSK